jgi:hypothetical protein
MTENRIKICTACGEEKPLDAFFGPYTDKQTGRQKWTGTCKACRAERRRALQPVSPGKRDIAREQRLRDYPGSKVCTACGEEKPLADFGQPAQRDHAAGRVALVFNARCLPCQARANRARRPSRGSGEK